MAEPQAGPSYTDGVSDAEMADAPFDNLDEPNSDAPGEYTLQVLRSLSELRPEENWDLYGQRMMQLSADSGAPAIATFILANYPQFREEVPPRMAEQEISLAQLEPISGAGLLEATLEKLLEKYSPSAGASESVQSAESADASASDSLASSLASSRASSAPISSMTGVATGSTAVLSAGRIAQPAAASGNKMWPQDGPMPYETLLQYFERLLDFTDAEDAVVDRNKYGAYRDVLQFIALTLRDPACERLKHNYSEMPRRCAQLLRGGLAPRIWLDIRELMVAWLEERAIGARRATVDTNSSGTNSSSEPFQTYLARQMDAWFHRLNALAHVLGWLDGVPPTPVQESKFRVLVLGMLSKYVLLDSTVFRKIIDTTITETDNAMLRTSPLAVDTGNVCKVVLATVPLEQQRQFMARVAASTAATGTAAMQKAAGEQARADYLLRTLCDTFATWSRASSAAWYQLRIGACQVGAEALLVAQLRVLMQWLPALTTLFGEALVHNNLGAVTALLRLVSDFRGVRKSAQRLMAAQIGAYLDAINTSDLTQVGKGRVLERLYALVARAMTETPQNTVDIELVWRAAIEGARVTQEELQRQLAEFAVFEAAAICMLSDVPVERRQQGARRLQHACSFATTMEDSETFEMTFFWRFAHMIAPRGGGKKLHYTLSDDVLVEALGSLTPETLLALRVMVSDLEVSLWVSHVTDIEVSVTNQTNWPFQLGDEDEHGVTTGPHAGKARELENHYRELYPDRVAKMSPSLSTIELSIRNQTATFQVEVTLAQEAIIRHLSVNGVTTFEELVAGTKLSTQQLRLALQDLVSSKVKLVLWRPVATAAGAGATSASAAAAAAKRQFSPADQFGLNPIAKPVQFGHTLRVDNEICC